MRNSLVIFSTLSVLLSTLFINSTVFAGDIEWSGVYRIEGYDLHNTEMRSSNKKELAYGLSHLVLRPKITAGDGVTIYGQFDIFNNANYPNSQMGQTFGSGVRGAAPSTSQDDSNTLSHNQKAETIEVSQLYMTLNHEFGQLIVGRAPLHFGLGITHNAGRGLFDHFYDTRDMVGYKFVMGNLYFLPMFGKSSEAHVNQSDDIDDYMIQVQYENPETDLELGVFYQLRKGGDQGSDAVIPTGTAVAGDGSVLGGAGATNATGVNSKTVNLYALKDTARFRLGMEASFMSGEVGVLTAGNEKVTWSGFGLAGEFEYRPEASKWKWGLKAGSASGDDPLSDTKFEGFTFNRNYDVAMLMFNHPLGQADFLRTKLVTGAVRDATTNDIDKTDVEAVSNVVYVAPMAKYAISDRWSLDNTLITGWVSTNPIVGTSASKQLGYEWDASLNFVPRKGVAWINQIGMLFPGATWKADNTFTNNFTFGFATKAAISF